MVEETILKALHEEEISPCVTVPCKFLAEIITGLEANPNRQLVFPSREEEGIGICAGAYLAGQYPIMIMQNSGLGNLVNAYCSLNQHYQIPIFFLISYRGEELEKVAAQRPMGSITLALLALLQIESYVFTEPGQASEFPGILHQYRNQKKSIAVLLRPSFFRD